ncbi:MAG: hypothetical protein H7829_03360 [Magnetococcus sp. THC-1_WYH]
MTIAAANMVLDITPAEADEPFELVIDGAVQDGSSPIELAYTAQTVFVEDLQNKE